MSLRAATVHSVNTVYAQLIDRVGPEAVVETAERMGAPCCRRVNNPEASARAVPVRGAGYERGEHARDGVGVRHARQRRAAHLARARVADHGRARHGALETNAEPERVLDPQASTANDILNDVVLYGTGTAANIGRPQIGKTGTAMDHSDAWFVGAIPQMVAAIWVGYPKGQIRMDPRTRITVYGGTWPAQIWRLLMLDASRGLPVMDFPESEGGLRVGRRRRLATAVLPAQPVHAPAEHPVDGVHRRHGTDRAVYLPTRCSRWWSLGDRRDGGPRDRGRLRPVFYVDVTTAPSTQPNGTVIMQNPAAGTDAFQTSTVTITVSWTEPEEPSPSPSA